MQKKILPRHKTCNVWRILFEKIVMTNIQLSISNILYFLHQNFIFFVEKQIITPSICRAPWVDNNQLWDDKRTLDQGWRMNKGSTTGDHQMAAIACCLVEFVFVCLLVCLFVNRKLTMLMVRNKVSAIVCFLQNLFMFTCLFVC